MNMMHPEEKDIKVRIYSDAIEKAASITDLEDCYEMFKELHQRCLCAGNAIAIDSAASIAKTCVKRLEDILEDEYDR